MLNTNRKKVALSAVFAIFLIVSITMTHGKIKAESEDMYEKLKVFSDVLSIVQKNYVEETKPEDLIYGAINGMLRTLDPHSSFMRPDLYKELQVETQGSFGGIGIEITIRKGILTIVSPIEDTPGFKAGLKSGDKIVKIEDEYTENMTLLDAVKRMRGPAGEKVTISIMRKGFTEPKDFTLTREVIRIKSVKYKLLEENTIGYIRLSQFQEKTGGEFNKALDTLEQGDNPLIGLVLDLRNNPGGLLDQAVKVCDTFIDEGLIVYTQGRTEGQQMRFTAHPNIKPHDYPIIVLVNGGSASGSEIVAGALQDHNRAVILGTPTFGKGSVQTIIPLDDRSGLRLTTARYYTPSGKSIQATGIIPDVVVKEDFLHMDEDKKKIKFIKEKDLDGHFEPEGETEEITGTEEEEEAEKDTQLTRATQLIKSWHIFKEFESKNQQAVAP
jgi:carboxyl-terminal processing protease